MINQVFIAFVIIARNEEKNIACCIESALAALNKFRDSSVVLVDSNSTDRTVSIAQAFPISIYRYKDDIQTAAAGRRIGFNSISAKYVFFLDGDCLVNPDWLENGLITLEKNPLVGVTFGSRREVYSDLTLPNIDNLDEDDCSLGGNALYRAEALKISGSFNPYLVTEEEAELLGRLRSNGFRASPTRGVMITHHTTPKSSFQFIVRRQRLGLYRGHGHLLRLSIPQGLFRYHATRFNRYLATLFLIFAGIGSLVASFLSGNPIFLITWLFITISAFFFLWFRRKQLSTAIWIVTDWIFGALAIIREFMHRPLKPDAFNPAIERIK